MATKPLVFISYSQADDNYEKGALWRFRNAVSEALGFVSDAEIAIFQNDSDVAIGQTIQNRIDQSLNEAMVLVPVLTPGFFKDPICKDILDRFLKRENQLSRNDLVLAVYYKRVPALENPRESDEPFMHDMAQRKMIDWQQFRGKELDDPQVRNILEQLAERIDAILTELQPIKTLDILDDTGLLSGLHLSTQTYYKSKDVKSIIDRIYHRPYYHIIEADMGMGKTALISNLWNEYKRNNRSVIIHTFSHETNRTNVQQAIISLHQQLSHLAQPRSILPEREDVLSYNALRVATEQVGAIIVLIDGLDECRDPENFRNLFPPSLDSNITCVLTTRPSLKDILLPHLPREHILRGLTPEYKDKVTVSDIPRFTQEDIAHLLQERGVIDNDDTMAKQIYQQSDEGKPLWVSLFCENMQHDKNPSSVLQNMEASWKWVLQDMYNRCPESDHVWFAQVLMLLVAAKSGLDLSELTEILELEGNKGLRRNLDNIYNALHRYLPRREEMEIDFFDGRFREYLQQSADYRAELLNADTRLRNWVSYHVQNTDTAHIPHYVLRHFAEYYANSEELYYLFAQRKWLDELQRRTHRRACVDAVMRAWAAAEEALSKESVHTQITNLIICAIMKTSLTATLLPELVLKLAKMNLWSNEKARDYARLYELPDNQRTVLEGLESGKQPDIPEGSPAADAAQELMLLIKWTPPHRQDQEMDEWVRRWEARSATLIKQLDSERLELLLEALTQPAQEIDDLDKIHVAPPIKLDIVLDEIKQYNLSPTGQLDDPNFEILLFDLTEVWKSTNISDSYWLSPAIIQSISRGSRTDLLGTLEILAPAFCTLFPKSIDRMRIAIKEVVTAYLK